MAKLPTTTTHCPTFPLTTDPHTSCAALTCLSQTWRGWTGVGEVERKEWDLSQKRWELLYMPFWHCRVRKMRLLFFCIVFSLHASICAARLLAFLPPSIEEQTGLGQTDHGSSYVPLPLPGSGGWMMENGRNLTACDRVGNEASPAYHHTNVTFGYFFMYHYSFPIQD